MRERKGRGRHSGGIGREVGGRQRERGRGRQLEGARWEGTLEEGRRGGKREVGGEVERGRREREEGKR